MPDINQQVTAYKQECLKLIRERKTIETALIPTEMKERFLGVIAARLEQIDREFLTTSPAQAGKTTAKEPLRGA